MKTMKGPAIFLAQFAGDRAPFDSLASIARWAPPKGSMRWTAPIPGFTPPLYGP